MCLEKPTLADGTVIACRKCRLCRENAINDWVGRCIAESKTASVSYCFTLTYGRDQDESSPFYGSEDHPRAKVLTYSDVQKLLKLLRRHKWKFRYFVVGEYGSTKGRSHWHVVIFFYGSAPALAGRNSFGTWSDRHLSRGHDEKDKIRFMWQRLNAKGEPVMVKGKPAYWWPHGWVEVSEASHAGIRYNTKYIQKDIGEAERQGQLMMSKKPPLGTSYFLEQAELMVKQGVTLRDTFYTFDEARTKKGELIRFRLKPPTYDAEGNRVSGAVAQAYIDRYVDLWWDLRVQDKARFSRDEPEEWLPPSEFWKERFDKDWERWRTANNADVEFKERQAKAGARKPYMDADDWVSQFALENPEDPEGIERVRQWRERELEQEWKDGIANTPREELGGLSINQWDAIHGEGSYIAFHREAEQLDKKKRSASVVRQDDIDTPEHRKIWAQDLEPKNPHGPEAG